MSIAASVLDAVSAESLLRGGGRVTHTDLASARFEIEFVPWARRCRACGSRDTEAAGGDQMELTFLELEET